MYGHIHKLATAIAEGARKTGVEVQMWQVAETLPPEVLEKMHAGAKPDLPVISPRQLADADGIIFGFPTRFGMMAAQMKALFDATGGLWKEGKCFLTCFSCIELACWLENR